MPSESNPADDREQALLEVIEAVSRRRAAGEELSDEAVIAEHADLMPDLAERLATLRKVEGVFRRASVVTPHPTANPSGSPLSGDVLSGYDIHGEIHRGGQGVIYLATQKGTRRRVAIKVMREGPFAGPQDRLRFEREVQILGQLHHSSIVTIFDSGTAAGCFYYVMDYIEGQPLDVFVSDRGPSTAQLLQLFVKICEAVNAAHRRGVIHRDLKPSNIRIDPQGEPHILDFGLARFAELEDDYRSMTLTGQFVGSLPWAAPEQAAARSGQIDTRTDVYALGVILYQMLTGRFPYEVVGNMRDVLDRIIQTDPVRPATLCPSIDHELETIVLKCLTKDRDRRYQTAGELARDLHHYLAGEPIEAKRDSTLYVLNKLVSRYKKTVAAAAIVAVFLSVSTVISLVLYRLADQERVRAVELELNAFASSADRAFNEGLRLCDEGKVGEGLLRFAALLEDESNRPELASFWQLLRANLAAWSGQIHPLREIFVYEGRVHDVAIHPNGSRIAVALDGNVAIICNAATGRPVAPPLRHPDSEKGAVVCIAFSEDGLRVATGSEDHTARMWDAQTGDPMGPVLKHDAAVRCLAFSPNGDLLLTGSSDGSARIWDAYTGQPFGTRFSHKGTVRAVEFSRDGSMVLTASEDGTAQVWDVNAQQPMGKAIEHPGPILAATFSPNGQHVVVGGGGNHARLWNWAAGQSVGERFRHTEVVVAVAFSPNGEAILTGSTDRTVLVWDASTSERRGAPLHHERWVRSVRFSPDGNRVFTAGYDKTVRVWERRDGASPQRTFVHSQWVGAHAFNTDGSRILTASSDNVVRSWDASTGNLVADPHQYSGTVADVAFDGDRPVALVIADDQLEVWDALAFQPAIPPLRSDPDGSPVHATALSPDGRFVAAGMEDGSVRVWESDSARIISHFDVHTEVITTLAFDRAASRLLTGSGDYAVRLWDLDDDASEVGRWRHRGPVNYVAFDRGGRVALSCSSDNTVRRWDLGTGDEIGRPLLHPSSVTSLDQSAHDSRIVTGCWDAHARIWDAATGKRIGPLLRHGGGVLRVAFSPDGASILTGSQDHVVRLWRAPPPAVDATVERVAVWLRVLSGLDLDSQGVVYALLPEEWRNHHRELHAMGGPPIP